MSGSDTGRILVVDDVPENVRLLEAVLLPRGYDVVSAADGRAALELAGSTQPDLVLLDVMMRGSTDTRSVACSGSARRRRPPGDHGHRERRPREVMAIEAGADDFVTKPFDHRERLYAEVEGEVEVETVGELTLKGFQEPVAAFNVLAVSDAVVEAAPL